ncbi:MAG: ABC transporter permease [Pseudolabrys sp.]|nr:ABC transporter permease [Pseudolabrys sp.]
MKIPSFISTFGSIAGGLLLWELVARVVIDNSLFLAAPSQIGLQIVQLWATGELQIHMLVSGQEFFIGLVLAIVIGVGIGFLIATSLTARRILGPWVSALYATPTIAIAPLVVLWLGIDIWSKVVVVVINAMFPVIINTETGLRSTDRRLIETVRCFGASSMQVFWNVMLPSAIPYILAGVRLAVGRAIVSVVVAELFGSRAGLGFMLVQASEVFNMPKLFAAVVVLAVVGMLLTSFAQWMEKVLQPWNRP